MAGTTPREFDLGPLADLRLRDARRARYVLGGSCLLMLGVAAYAAVSQLVYRPPPLSSDELWFPSVGIFIVGFSWVFRSLGTSVVAATLDESSLRFTCRGRRMLVYGWKDPRFRMTLVDRELAPRDGIPRPHAYAIQSFPYTYIPVTRELFEATLEQARNHKLAIDRASLPAGMGERARTIYRVFGRGRLLAGRAPSR